MATVQTPFEARTSEPRNFQGALRKVAIFISCDSFEGFYGGIFGITRDFFVNSYRNDFVWDYAHGLRSVGHRIVIYVLSYGPPALYETHDGLQVRFLQLAGWLRPIDSLLWRLRKTPHVPVLRTRLAYLGYGRALQSALLEDQIEVIYHQEIWSSRFDLIVEKSRIPVIGADHGAIYQDWMANVKRKSFPKAAAVTSQAPEGQERAHKLGGNSILLSNGVDTNFFSPAPERARTKTILAVGRLVNEQKRFSDLLRALNVLPEFTLTLVGAGPDEAMLKALTDELNLNDRVQFAGFISDKTKLLELYQTCGVFVSTSAFEGLAMVMLEAMSCAVPVVATRLPSVEMVLTDGWNGLLVSVGAPEQVAIAVQSAYDRRGELGSNARDTIQARFSSDAVYSRLSELIERA